MRAPFFLSNSVFFRRNSPPSPLLKVFKSLTRRIVHSHADRSSINLSQTPSYLLSDHLYSQCLEGIYSLLLANLLSILKLFRGNRCRFELRRCFNPPLRSIPRTEGTPMQTAILVIRWYLFAFQASGKINYTLLRTPANRSSVCRTRLEDS